MKDELIQIGGKSYKQCEVVMLPTNKKELSNNQIYELYGQFNLSMSKVGELTWEDFTHSHNINPQHLYILSSEEIKEGDWVYHPEVGKEYTIVDTRKEGNDRYSKGLHPNQGVYKHKSTTNTWYLKEKKIIATTDESLTYKISVDCGSSIGNTLHTKNLPRPSDDFLKAYVKAQGKGFDKVLVEINTEFYADSKPFATKVSRDSYVQKVRASHSCWTKNLGVKTAPDNTITIKPVQEVYVSEKALPFVIEALGFNPLEEDFLGKEAIRYCKEKDYEGSAFYNVAMKAIEFGYQLAQKEIESEEKTSWTRSEVIELCKKAMINDEHYDGFRTYLFDKWIKENL